MSDNMDVMIALWNERDRLRTDLTYAIKRGDRIWQDNESLRLRLNEEYAVGYRNGLEEAERALVDVPITCGVFHCIEAIRLVPRGK